MVDPNSVQRGIFFLKMEDFLADASNTTGLAHLKNPYLDDTIGLQNAAYPPFAYLLFYLLSRVSGSVPEKYLNYYQDPLWLFILIIYLVVLFIVLYTLAVKKLGGADNFDNILFGISLCVSQPMLMTVERGNIILLTVVLLMAYVFYYGSESKVKKELALICLALAAGIKLTPAIFGILLIYNKDWKAAFRTVIYGILVFFVPFFFFEGGIHNLSNMLNNVGLHSQLVKDSGGTTLEGIFRFWNENFIGVFFGKPLEWTEGFDLFLKTIKIIASLLLLFTGFITDKQWLRILNVSMTLLILPAVSMNYCILYLLPFVIIYMNETGNKKTDVLGKIILLSFILIGFVFMFEYSKNINRSGIAVILLLIAAIINSVTEIKNKLYNLKGTKKNG